MVAFRMTTGADGCRTYVDGYWGRSALKESAGLALLVAAAQPVSRPRPIVGQMITRDMGWLT